MKTENRIKTVQTRYNETKLLAKTPEEMFGMYAAENINHVWHEDLTDEATGNVVSVERKQLLFERGTFFDGRNIDSVRFYFDAKSFTEALVSDQCRIGNEIEHYGLQAYKVKVSVNGKNNVFVCQARSLTMAQEIIKDWCELHLESSFLIVSVAELSTGIILNAVLKKREEASAENAEESAEAQKVEEPLPALDGDSDDIEIEFADEENAEAQKTVNDKPAPKSASGYYEVQLEIHFKQKDGDLKHTSIKGFLVEAKDADAARDACFGYIDMTRNDADVIEEIRIISATPFNCYKVIEREFTAAYIDAEEDKSNQ